MGSVSHFRENNFAISLDKGTDDTNVILRYCSTNHTDIGNSVPPSLANCNRNEVIDLSSDFESNVLSNNERDKPNVDHPLDDIVIDVEYEGILKLIC